MIVVVMGVSGVGKTTIGTALALELGWRFIDADRYHPPENVAKMAAGLALDDEDRRPWLETLNRIVRKEKNAVLACSALKEAYRSRITDGLARFEIVYLHGSFELIRAPRGAASPLHAGLAPRKPVRDARASGQGNRHRRGCDAFSLR